MTPIRVLSKLFEARDEIHYLHLHSKSYAEHKALNEFYDGWLDLLDTFVETYQGRYGRIEGSISFDLSTEINPTDYLKQLYDIVLNDFPNIYVPAVDTDLENIIADMKQLINHTLYLLTLK